LCRVILKLNSSDYSVVENFVKLSPELIKFLYLEQSPCSDQVQPIDQQVDL